MMRGVIFDAHALLAWIRGEPEADFVRVQLDAVQDSGRAGGACVVNIGEVYYCLARDEGLADAEDFLDVAHELKWRLFDVDRRLVFSAARLKSRFAISYADAFAIACAQQQEASLVSGDPEIIKAGHGVPILWPGVGDTPEEQPLEQ